MTRLVPSKSNLIRFAKFCLVGWSGVAVHFVVLYCLTEFLSIHYIISATLAVITAATNNYTWNNKWTFKDKQNTNWVKGWIKYLITVGVSEFIYLGLLAVLTEAAGLWYLLSAAIAMIITSVTRYFAVSKLIWRKTKDAISSGIDAKPSS